MIPPVDHARLFALASADRELLYKLRGVTAKARFAIGDAPIDVSIEDGRPTAVRPAGGDADVTIVAPDGFWAGALSAALPPPGHESLTMGFANGVRYEGALETLVAPYQGAWQRLFLLLRESVCGPASRPPAPEPPRQTDNAIGRYRYVHANGEEARIYYEEAGTGEIPLLLQPTAGADGREYRHLLASPEMQRRFRMIAYDLPYHGKSLPPIGVRWWEQPYKPTRDYLMNWVVAIADSLALERPFFMGCSVGGQLALDLAAFHGARFGAFIAVNGWYDMPQGPRSVSNDMFRDPKISEDFPMSIILGGTAPTAPEALAEEVYWIYRSNFPGVYAGDNDYFFDHDLKPVRHRIDAARTPLFVIAGEYDSAAASVEHGGQAVAANVPGVVYLEAKGLGHFAPSEDPKSFERILVPVLDEIIDRTRSSRAADSGAPVEKAL